MDPYLFVAVSISGRPGRMRDIWRTSRSWGRSENQRLDPQPGLPTQRCSRDEHLCRGYGFEPDLFDCWHHILDMLHFLPHAVQWYN